MKHVFVVNPNAGQKNISETIIKDIEENFKDLDHIIYVTKCRHDALRYVKEFLEKNSKDETYRFYAVGGDGTLYDVVNGAVGYDNAEIACVAHGSGNDFIKNFRCDISNFRDLSKAIKGKAIPIDIMKINDKYCINITNYGFDGEVTDCQLRYRRIPGVSGPLAYKLAAFNSLLFNMKFNMKIFVDDKEICNGKELLAIAANGYCYGGGFYCAPEAIINDGLIDFIIIDKIGRLKAASFMSIFRKGEHLVNPKVKDKVTFVRGKKAIFEGEKPIAYAVDGEVFRDPKIEIEMLPKALKFVLPEGVEYII